MNLLGPRCRPRARFSQLVDVTRVNVKALPTAYAVLPYAESVADVAGLP